MRVRSARFVTGAASPRSLPPEHLPEIAFAGRSNVGKSSLLNRLLGRRAMARVSNSPGRTQQINFFCIDERFLFVDLPGYGFARVPLSVREQWGHLIAHYLTGRRMLRGVVLLVDARRDLKQQEAQLIEFLDYHDVPVLVAVTKVDKLKRGERGARLRGIREQVGERSLVACSAVSGEGVDALWGMLKDLLTEESRNPKRAAT